MRPSFQLSNTNILCAMAIVPMLLGAEFIIGDEASNDYSSTKASEIVRDATYLTVYGAAAKAMAQEDETVEIEATPPLGEVHPEEAQLVQAQPVEAEIPSRPKSPSLAAPSKPTGVRLINGVSARAKVHEKQAAADLDDEVGISTSSFREQSSRERSSFSGQPNSVRFAE